MARSNLQFEGARCSVLTAAENAGQPQTSCHLLYVKTSQINLAKPQTCNEHVMYVRVRHVRHGAKPAPFSGELSCTARCKNKRQKHRFAVFMLSKSLSIRVGDGSGVRQPRFRLFSFTAERMSAKATSPQDHD